MPMANALEEQKTQTPARAVIIQAAVIPAAKEAIS